MTIYSSRSTCSFYDDAINPELPGDAVEISFELHVALRAGQEQGKLIDFDEEPPVLRDPPPLSSEQQAVIERAWRDGQLTATDPIITRHRDERDMTRPTSLADAQFVELQGYRQELRDWPAEGMFPLPEQRPAPPVWLTEHLQ